MSSTSLTVSDQYIISPSTELPDSIHFEEGGYILLQDWTGSLKELLPAEAMSGICPDIHLDGDSFVSACNVQLFAQSEAFGDFRVTDRIYLWSQILTLESGVSLVMDNKEGGIVVGSTGTLILKGNNQLVDSYYGYVTVTLYGRLVCGEACRIAFMTLHPGSTVEAEELIIENQLIVLPGATVSGTLSFEEGANIYLDQWSGSTAELLSGANVLGCPEVRLISSSEEDDCFKPGADIVLADLGAAFGDYRVYDETLNNNRVTVEKGVDIQFGSSGVLVVSEDSSLILEGNNKLISSPDAAYYALLVEGYLECGDDCRVDFLLLRSGSSTVAEELIIGQQLSVFPDADVSGTISFEEGATIGLWQWSGSTAELLHGVRVSGCPDILLYREKSFLSGADVLLADMGKAYGDYIFVSVKLEHNRVTVESGVDFRSDDSGSFTVGEGSSLILQGNNTMTSGTIVLESGGVLTAGEGCALDRVIIDAESTAILREETRVVELEVLSGGVLSSRETLVEEYLDLYPDSHVEGTVNFAEGAGVYLNDWDGGTADALSWLSAAGGNPSVRLCSLAENGSVVLEKLEGLVEEYRVIYSQYLTNQHVVIQSGVTLTAEGIYFEVGNNASWRMESGSRLESGYKWVAMDVTSGGTMELNGADLGGAYIFYGGVDLRVDGCQNIGCLGIESSDEGSVCRISNCDLSRTEIVISSVCTAQIDLSGNYWGTLDMEEIKAMIVGYENADIIINNVLGVTPETSVPGLIMRRMDVEKVASQPGLARLDMAWEYGEDDVLYTLRVDGKIVCSGWDTQYSGLFKDGAHEYQLIIIDSRGKASSHEGSFYIDCTAPTLKLGKPACTKWAEGEMEVSLSWSGEVGSGYTVRVDGKTVYSGRDSRCSFVMEDGEHDYSVTATDAAGNETTCTGQLSFDATAPENVKLHRVTLADIVPTTNKGQGKITFRWEGEAGTRYTLMVDGKKAYSGTATEKTLTLSDGEHSYSLIAQDKAGNVVEIVSSANTPSFDATAPTLIAEAVEVKQGVATLRWQSSESATYTLTIMKGKEQVLQRTIEGSESFTTPTALAEGSYSYTLQAEDDALNFSAVKKGSFTVGSSDTSAPTVSALAHSVKPGKNGAASATISWGSSEKGSSYTLMLNGEVVYVGTAAKYSFAVDSGTCTYSVIATDKAGNRSDGSASGSFRYNPAGLSHTLTKNADGASTTATLSWVQESGTDYVLTVDGKVKEPGGNGRYVWENLRDGKHSYTLTATTKGNSIIYSGSFVADTKAPTLKLNKAVCSKAGEGEMLAKLSWKSEKNATYLLSIDGGEAIELTEASYSTRLADGEHSYSVIAVDAAGNAGKAVYGSFSYDATAPDIILGEISGSAVSSKGSTRTRSVFCWVGEDGVSYTVKVDGKKYSAKKYTQKQSIDGKSSTVTLSTLSVTTDALAAGEHSYVITARDKAGNVSEISGSFLTDSEGNAIWVYKENNAPTLSRIPEGAQELSWSAEDTQGIAQSAAQGLAGYSFELTEARQLLVKLDGLQSDAIVRLQQLHGSGSIELSAHQATGLDRELSLSAGTYYLQVEHAGGIQSQLGSYTLDLELEQAGRTQPMQQGTLA